MVYGLCFIIPIQLTRKNVIQRDVYPGLRVFFIALLRGCRFVPSTFSETKPQMVPKDQNIGFQGLALIQGQIYNPVVFLILTYTCFPTLSRGLTLSHRQLLHAS